MIKKMPYAGNNTAIKQISITRKRVSFNLMSAILIILTLIFFIRDIAIAKENLKVSDKAETTSFESVHELLSGLSDEQVRQMLIRELRDQSRAGDNPFSTAPEVRGPGAPLNKLLGALNNESKQSENQLRYLWEGIPNLLPDLYKVFVSL